MTIKEAILISLKDFPKGAIAREVYQNIIDKGIFKFNINAKTPDATISANLVTMAKKGDTRIGRFKNEKNVYCYYLSDYAKNIGNITASQTQKSDISNVTFHERDLHPLLCCFLHHQGIMAKTIFHEKSKKDDEHQKWIHPDIIGAKFVEQINTVSNSLFKAISKKDSLRLYSYELKRKIDNDYELKKCFFQAVSNSSWANNGYLVAFEINEDLKDELARLNHSFGIGFILLKANPYESQIWLEAKDRQIDFKTVSKLCEINPNFKDFIKFVEAALTADEKHFTASKAALENICDKFPKSDGEIQKHCIDKHIPTNEEEFTEEI